MTIEGREAGDGSPDLAASMSRLAERMENLERMLSRLDEVVVQAPMAVGMATDTMDEMIRRASADGIDVDARGKQLMSLLLKLTDPKVSGALETLLSQGETLEQAAMMLEQAPMLAAMAADSADELVRRTTQNGIDVDRLLHQSGKGAARFAELLISDEFEALLDSGMFAPDTVKLLGLFAKSVAEQSKVSSAPVGLFGALGMLRDPDVQCATGFLFAALKRFGQAMRDAQCRLPEGPR
jgi:uncharacterized protein YjgD (DUF1641 family)